MMKNQSGSSRMDTVLKMLLIAFVSLLAFSTGVYFGKAMVEQDYQYKALESDFKHATTAAHDEHGKPEDAINEEEVAKLSDEYLNKEKDQLADAAQAAAHGDDHAGQNDGHGEKRSVASAHDDHAAPAAKAAAHDDHAAPAAKAAAHDDHAAPEAKAAAHDDHAAPAAKAAAHDDHAAPAKKAAAHDEHAATAKPDLDAAHKAVNRVVHGQAPVDDKPVAKESRIPTSLPKTVGTNGSVEFTVQVASYPTQEAAKAHANELVKKGFPAFPVEAVVNGRSWYRVSVGSFKSMKEATSYRATLLKQAELQSAIVQRITR